MILTIRIILLCLQGLLLIAAIFFLMLSRYHNHQSERILNRRGKQTFWQWVKHIDTERGTGIWK